MPFDFNNKPPALQPTGSFSSFATAANRSSHGIAAFSSPSFVKNEGSPLDTPSSFASFRTGQSAITSQPESRMSNAHAIDYEKAALATAAPDDILMQGLHRAVHGRPAIFGKAEMKVDEVLRNFVKCAMADGSDETKAAQLSKEMRTVLHNNPLARSFVSHLLAQAAGVTPIVSTPLVSRSATPVSSALAAQDRPLGVPTFEDGSPAFESIAAKFQERLLQKVLSYGDRIVDVQTWAERAARRISGGGWRVANAQDYISEALGQHRYHPDTIELLDALIECVHEVVYHDKLSTKGPKKVADNDDNVLFSVPRPVSKQLMAAKSATDTMTLSSVDVEAPESPSKLSFRLMDLPAELRLCMYRELFVPTGFISIRSGIVRTDVVYQKHVITGLSPTNLTPALLRTSRLIHKEANDIMFDDNTFYINSQLVYGSTTTQSMVGHLPQAMLPRFKSVMLVLDAVGTNHSFLKEPFHCDWRDLQLLTGLKEIRIVILFDHDPANDAEACSKRLLGHIIDRVPANAKITLGAREGPEQDHVEEFKKSLRESESGKHYGWAPFAVEDEVLKKAARDLYANQGCKSGSTRDFRWPEKKAFQLKPLAPLSANGKVNESIILGR